MENNKFLNKLLDLTNGCKLEWKLLTGIKSIDLSEMDVYYCKNNNKIIIIYKYYTYSADPSDPFSDGIRNINCALKLCDESYNDIYTFYEDDFKKPSDLLRLYRLVERDAKRVDGLLENFFDGLD